jgi:hydrogenase maturation factor
MLESSLPVGKLPLELLARLLQAAPILDPRILVGPGVGLDCSVVNLGETLLVMKSDPITFATDEIGWYAVQVNGNDIACAGATPRWFLMTLLLPEGKAPPELVERITRQVYQACAEKQISVVGGHTEITAGLPRPILLGTMLGETTPAGLVTPMGARLGDRLLLTKGIPIEATALLAREFPDRLRTALTETELSQARDYLYTPGISVLRDSQIARQAGQVTAMHDPTEGGLAAALWELAAACGLGLVVEQGAVPIPPLAGKVCAALGIDPLASIASGALLLAVAPQDSAAILQALKREGILCAEIGQVVGGAPQVRCAGSGELLPRPERDEIARLFESSRSERPG